MMNDHAFLQLTGWSAIGSSLLSVIATVALLLMFAVNSAWGPVNDAASVAWALLHIPIVILLYVLVRGVHPTLALIGSIVGMTCLLIFAIVQSALVIHLITFQQSEKAVILMWAGIAIWLLFSGVLAHAGESLPPLVISLTLLLGVSYAIGAAGYLSGGLESRLALFGYAGSAIIGPLWGIFLGWYLLRSGSVLPAGA